MIEFLLKDSEKRVTEFTVKDSFLVDEAAPLTSPRTAEPGPGTLTFVQTDGEFSITSTTLDYPGQSTPVWGDLGFYGGAVTRAAGLAAVMQINQDQANLFGPIMGFYSAVNLLFASIEAAFYFYNDGTLYLTEDGAFKSLGDAYTATTDYDVAVVLRATGAYLFIRGGTYTSWTLLYVLATNNTATLYPAMANWGATGSIDSVRVLNLPANGYAIWADDYGIATQRLAGARSAGDTFAHETTFLLEFTVTTVPSSGQIEVEFHREDADNKWRVTIDSTGALDLDEVVATVVTQRGTAAGVVANGDRIVVVQDGTNIKVYEANSLQITYAAGANTYTAGELETEGTGGAVSDLITWPRTLKSGGAGLGRGATA